MSTIDNREFNPMKQNKTVLVLSDSRWNNLDGSKRRLFMNLLRIMNKKNEFRTSKHDRNNIIKGAEISLSSFNRGMAFLTNKGFIAKKMRGYYIVNPRIAYKCKDAGYFYIEADLAFYMDGSFSYLPTVSTKATDGIEVSKDF